MICQKLARQPGLAAAAGAKRLNINQDLQEFTVFSQSILLLRSDFPYFSELLPKNCVVNAEAVAGRCIIFRELVPQAFSLRERPGAN